jgi:hypothetical protein
MAKARPLRKTGRKTGGKSAEKSVEKSVRERQLSGGEVKRTAAKQPPNAADRAPSRKPVLVRPTRKAVVVVPERQMVAPEVAPPLPSPIASFTF